VRESVGAYPLPTGPGGHAVALERHCVLDQHVLRALHAGIGSARSWSPRTGSAHSSITVLDQHVFRALHSGVGFGAWVVGFSRGASRARGFDVAV
jgi:hypothetical protein